MDLYNLLLLVVIPGLYFLGIKIKAFNRNGAIVAAIIGSIVIISGGALYFIILFLFLGFSYISTLAGFEKKKRKSLQEGLKGERKAKNVMAAGLAATGISVLNFFSISAVIVFALYVIALATILADTAASEIGSLDENTYMILTLKPAETGINGGISVLGTFTSLMFAMIFSLLAFLLFGITSALPLGKLTIYIVIAGFLGFIGNLFDSVLGETLENRGILDKYSVNFYASLFSTVIGIIIFLK